MLFPLALPELLLAAFDDEVVAAVVGDWAATNDEVMRTRARRRVTA